MALKSGTWGFRPTKSQEQLLNEIKTAPAQAVKKPLSILENKEHTKTDVVEYLVGLGLEVHKRRLKKLQQA